MNRFIWIILALISLNCLAQKGNYFLSHYTPAAGNIDHLSFDIEQDAQGIMYFANKAGVVMFDGRNWSLVETPGPVYTVCVVNGSEIFAAGLTGFGKLTYNEKNHMVYESLSDSLTFAHDVIFSLATQEFIFFVSHHDVIVFSLSKNKVEYVLPTPEETEFTAILDLNNQVYVSNDHAQIQKWNGKQFEVSDDFPEGQVPAISSSMPGMEQHIVVTDSGKFFLKIGDQPLRRFTPVDHAYLETNTVVDVAWMNENLLAFATLRGGILFVDAKSGSTVEMINYYTGLPDNEVFTIRTDHDKSLWVAHDYGFTRISPNLPFRAFHYYPGLQGNLLCEQSRGTDVYVGTSLGLFKLVREDSYEEQVYYVYVNVGVNQKKTTRSATIPVEPKRDEAKKGLFSFLKKKKQAADDKKKDGKKAEVKTTPAKTPPKPTVRAERRTRKVLKAVQYLFKPVQGITGKVSQLMLVNNKLLGAGVSGVFEVNDLNSTAVIEEPVRHLAYSRLLNQLLISLEEDEVVTYSPRPGGWTDTHLLDTLGMYVGYAFEDNLNNIWLCTHDGAIKVETKNGSITKVYRVPFARPSIDQTVGFSVGRDVFMISSGEFKRYDSQTEQFVQYDSLPGTRKYFAAGGDFWFHDGHRWLTMNDKLQSSINLDWLRMFQNIRYLSYDEASYGLWIITANNHLYRYSVREAQIESPKYPLLLREIKGHTEKLPLLYSVEVNQMESTLTFDVVKPEFISAEAVEYRYKVIGLTPDWSEWSTSNNQVHFPYLAPGKYELMVQAQDLFGIITDLQKVDLQVLPPYWKRSWFYALEFMLIGLLVYLTRRLEATRFRFLSDLMAVLTVVLLIQFFQAAVDSFLTVKTTPVVEFVIQVCIALLIFPVEKLIQKLLQRQKKFRMGKA